MSGESRRKIYHDEAEKEWQTSRVRKKVFTLLVHSSLSLLSITVFGSRDEWDSCWMKRSSADMNRLWFGRLGTHESRIHSRSPPRPETAFVRIRPAGLESHSGFREFRPDPDLHGDTFERKFLLFLPRMMNYVHGLAHSFPSGRCWWSIFICKKDCFYILQNLCVLM